MCKLCGLVFTGNGASRWLSHFQKREHGKSGVGGQGIGKNVCKCLHDADEAQKKCIAVESELLEQVRSYGLPETGTTATVVSRKRSRSSEAEAGNEAGAASRAKVPVNQIHGWDVDRVVAMLQSLKLPTEGAKEGQVDGSTLESLFREDDAEALFTAPPPEGLGFSKLQFRGRFTVEMRKLLAEH
jgi:hypothetical protein